jgi:hypothetical protein
MAKDLLDELRTEHLCTHYVLPLIGLSKFNFPTGNFDNTFLAHDPGRGRWFIAVRVVMTGLLSRSLFGAHPHYHATRRDERGYYYLLYRIPDQWHGDLYYFRCGEYSLMSAAAKEQIRHYSGLPYRELMPGSGERETDVRLLALDRATALKEYWERELGTTPERELLPKPRPDMYLELHLLQHIKGQSP